MHRSRSRTTAVRAAVVGATAVLTSAALAVGPAVAAPHLSRPLVTHLAGPLQLDVSPQGRVFVSQSFAGLLSRIQNGKARTVVGEPGIEIAGVAVRRRTIAYTTTTSDDNGALVSARLRVLDRDSGRTTTLANLKRYEARHNPDAHRRYGILGLDESCASQLPPDAGLLPYEGIVESHPYAVAKAPAGGWYVADAAGNDVVRVGPRGHIRTVWVGRPQRTEVTAAAAEALKLPACVAGATYVAEPVPTDVEVSRSGRLFVSLLPGGPESPDLGARGSVVSIDPATGRSHVKASGFLGATNVALGGHHRIYVTELFGNKVSVIRPNGHVRTVVDLPSPAAVETHRRKMYVAYDVFGPKAAVAQVLR